MNSDFSRKLQQIAQKLPTLIKRLPGIAKVEGLNFIHDNFDKQGFEQKPGVVKKWKSRENSSRKSLGRAVTVGGKRLGRNLLVDSGALRRSWDDESSTSGTAAIFSSSLPYAGIQNDGGKTSAHMIYAINKKALNTPYGHFKSVDHPGSEMPERKMIGDSEALTARIEDKADRMVDELLK